MTILELIPAAAMVQFATLAACQPVNFLEVNVKKPTL
jgi:hypothetical protein